jgi:hypothetical protein
VCAERGLFARRERVRGERGLLNKIIRANTKQLLSKVECGERERVRVRGKESMRERARAREREREYIQVIVAAAFVYMYACRRILFLFPYR